MSIPAAGTLLADKYRVTRLLGEGGMALVAEAVHEQLDQKVAIKFLRPEALAHGSLVARFAREARLMTRIRSEHVARVMDVGTLESGAPYMVMEYLQGMDLEARVVQHGPLAVERAVTLVLQACEALAEAHALGIIHRDLKPANLFLTARADGSDCVKVLDFGISKTRPGASEPDVSLTQTSALLGSPLYMAPEQMSSAKQVDERTDVWALGAILFELLTGSPPFPADSIVEIQHRMQQRRPLDIRALRDDVPEELRRVVLRCIEYEPSDRYADLAELAGALLPFAPDAKVSVDRIRRVLAASAPASGPVSPLARTEHAPASQAPPPAGERAPSQIDSAAAQVAPVHRATAARKRVWLPLGVALSVALIASALLPTARGRPGSEQPAAAAAPEVSEPAPQPVAAAETASATPQPAVAAQSSASAASSGSTATPSATRPAKPPAKKARSSATVEDSPPQPVPPTTAGTADLFNTRK